MVDDSKESLARDFASFCFDLSYFRRELASFCCDLSFFCYHPPVKDLEEEYGLSLEDEKGEDESSSEEKAEKPS